MNLSTFDSMAGDPRTAPILKDMRGADGKPRVCQKVWISSIGCAGDDTTEQTGKVTVGFGPSKEQFGPEFTFGIPRVTVVKKEHACKPGGAGPWLARY
ncbi:MAG: hypothetical protein NTW21_05510 [Verrucomicrobia bacterium]|nr:hypothetical protein [Verrucomicrobiota bacterium]